MSARLRASLPLGLRRTLRRGQRFATDLFQGARLSAPPVVDVGSWPLVATVRQELGTTPHAAAKQHNIALAAAAISGRPIAPGALFSFWGWLGRPTQAQGFQAGRALRRGRVVLETGGGLCQLAGALYFAGLKAGLCAVERHAHSVDLYTDDTRYTPLGSDATVSFGFKDLRLHNPHACPVAFDISAGPSNLRVEIRAPSAMAPRSPEFRVFPEVDGGKRVETWLAGRMIVEDRYRSV